MGIWRRLRRTHEVGYELCKDRAEFLMFDKVHSAVCEGIKELPIGIISVIITCCGIIKDLY